MADEKNTQTTSKPAKKKVKGSNRIAKWFREMRSELKKVVWPTGKQVLNNTIVACVVMIVAGIVLWAFDQLAMVIVNALISIGK